MTVNLLDFDRQGLIAYCEQLGEKASELRSFFVGYTKKANLISLK